VKGQPETEAQGQEKEGENGPKPTLKEREEQPIAEPKRPLPAIVVDGADDLNHDRSYKNVDLNEDTVPIMLDVPQRSVTKKSMNRKSIWQFDGWWEIQELWRRRTVIGRKGTFKDRYAGAAV
jgi:hypothetical protein